MNGVKSHTAQRR